MKQASDVLAKLPALAEFRFQVRTFLAFSEATAERHGITAQQYQLLQVVGQAAPEGIPITHVAERLLLRHHSAVELIDRAEFAGLVQRTADAADHRRARIRITPRGRQVMAVLVPEHLAFVQQAGPALMQALGQLLGPEAGESEHAC